ncbi:MAG: TetR/AcrR family transcriptional regulator [Anaerolineae bacterium]|nr:TetR/AcrR family transcriptional regulator [Anaerolineae bacterium]NUQ04418.1 TetR/AcrR family transcriptional regulator [Anaerolineae bacterium]
MNDQYHHGDLKNALIQAGIEILSKEGVQALSLRSVARRAGVSHAAPYAHFADKEALIAAIAAEGYRKLYAKLTAAQQASGDPLVRLHQTAFAYLQFALDEPDHFRITFAGVVEAERDYPEYVEQSQRCYALVVELVKACQARGLFTDEDTQLFAVSIWSSIHGFAQLAIANQLPGALVSRKSIHDIFRFHLRQLLAGLEKP